MKKHSHPFISVNGQITDQVSALDRGLAYGDGVFETAKVRSGSLPLWNYHKARLLEGCQRLHIPLDIAELDSWVEALLQQVFSSPENPAADHSVSSDAILKVVVSRGVGGRGYDVDASLEPTVICSLQPLVQQELVKPVDLHLCQHRLPLNSLLAGIKHLNRLDNVMLKYECQQMGLEDGLVLDERGCVIEATSSNVFFQRGEIIYTPAIISSGVSGVMRRLLLEEVLPGLGITCIVENISEADLARFEQGFLCNSVRGLTEIASVAGRRFSSAQHFAAINSALGSSRFYTP